jgi:hypothetical protein
MSIRISRHQAALGVGFLGLAALAVVWSHQEALSRATATPPPQVAANGETPPPPTPPEPSSDYSRRVVAYIYDTLPITREELGEYLIARLGAERLRNLVNKRIIEHACRQKGIEVTAAEVEADLAETIKGAQLNQKQFVEEVLRKQYRKSLYEWKEDVIRPKLLMTKLCRDRVVVTEEEIQKCYEAHYGEKIDCRIILWPKAEEKRAMMIYPTIRDNPEEFDRVAKQQASPTLAATGGQIKPIGRYTTGSDEMEKAAFQLRPGELSTLIGTPEGFVVIKCIERLPPDISKKMEDVRADLQQEVLEKKIQLEIPKVFAELTEQANPKHILKEYTTEEELLRDVRQELNSDGGRPGAPPGR